MNLFRASLVPCLFAFLLVCGCGSNSSAAKVESVRLTNGLQVLAIEFPGSTNVSLFTFLPMGLAADGPGQTQWSHLIEHLVVRGTVPPMVAWANGETVADHMRLDFYGSTNNWRDGLRHHRRWLAGEPFRDAVLQAEKPRVNSECDYTVRNLATGKFAFTAWNQVVRHGRTNVAVRGDVERATLAGLQAERDARLVQPGRCLVCVVGGLPAGEVIAALKEELSGIAVRGQPQPPLKVVPWSGTATWDLEARHWLMTWPIPGPEHPDYAALMAVALSLIQPLNSDGQLQRHAGQSFAGVDLVTPEGSFFYVTVPLRNGADPKAVRERVHHHLDALRNSPASATFTARQLAQSMAGLPDVNLMAAQAPASMNRGMMEANVGLQWALQEFRFGTARAQLVGSLRSVSADAVVGSVTRYLAADRASELLIEPRLAR
jgi:hypothetical protein